MRRYVLAALATLLVACGSDKATGPESVSGSYTLRTVNGGSIPAVVYQDAQIKGEIVSSTIALAADHSWTGTLTLRTTSLSTGVAVPETFPISGTYSLSGGTIHLTDAPDQLTFDGTVAGGTMTLTSDIVVGATTTLVFQR